MPKMTDVPFNILKNFCMGTPNITVTPTSDDTYFTVSSSVSSNGIVDPSGMISVLEGSSQTFNFYPLAGYLISNVVIDGTPSGAISSYTFDNINENHEILVIFESIPTNTISPFYVGTSTWTVPENVTSVDVLLIGGGGGSSGGGGGAGGYRELTLSVTPGDVYTIVVGDGGSSGRASGSISSGGDTYIKTGVGQTEGTDKFTATGGGAAGWVATYQFGNDGGSGGGNSSAYDSGVPRTRGGIGNNPATSPSQGNDGGQSAWGGGEWYNASGNGGGGGAGGAGGNAIITATSPMWLWTNGDGGLGVYNNILGAYCCGGGAAGGYLSPEDIEAFLPSVVYNQISPGNVVDGSGDTCYGGGGNCYWTNYLTPYDGTNGGPGIVVISYGQRTVQDFTTFTEVDPQNVLSQTSDAASFTSMSTRREPLVYLYKDYGYGYFGTSFTHDFTFYLTSFQYYGCIGVYGLTNTIGVAYGNFPIVLDVYCPFGANPIIRNPHNNIPSAWHTFTAGSNLYVRVVRDGVNVTMKIYSDEERINLLFSTTYDIGTTDSYRYLVTTTNGTDNQWTTYATGYIENLAFHTHI